MKLKPKAEKLLNALYTARNEKSKIQASKQLFKLAMQGYKTQRRQENQMSNFDMSLDALQEASGTNGGKRQAPKA